MLDSRTRAVLVSADHAEVFVDLEIDAYHATDMVPVDIGLWFTTGRQRVLIPWTSIVAVILDDT